MVHGRVSGTEHGGTGVIAGHRRAAVLPHGTFVRRARRLARGRGSGGEQ